MNDEDSNTGFGFAKLDFLELGPVRMIGAPCVLYLRANKVEQGRYNSK